MTNHRMDRKCVGCGADPPIVEGPITLLSLQHGWRLERTTLPSGETLTQWRCRECWMAYRRGILRHPK